MVARYSWFVLLVLALIYVQQQWSRYSLNYLYNVSADDDETSIAVADHVSFADYGILTGYGFSATFCIAGLFAGRAADVMSRRMIVFAGVAIWNVALFMMGYSTSFGLLLVWRLVLGFGQAFTNPASYSLIADYFPEEHRAQANGLFACGVYIGGGLASLCISMAQSLGWRFTCFGIALVGFGLAAVQALFVQEPDRVKKKSEALDKQRTFEEAMRTIFANKLVVLIFAASALRFMGGYAIAGYLPTFYDVKFPSYDSEYSYINAYVVAAGGFFSSWLGGMIADKWHAVEPRARAYLPALGCFLALPFMAVCCLAPNFYVSILVGLFMEYLMAECWFGPVVATMQSSLDNDCRALAIACFTLIATFFGSAASYAIGLVYDALLKTYPAQIIQWLVLWSVVISYASSGILFLYISTLVNPGPVRATEARPLLGGDPPSASTGKDTA